jgi:hypothetical protein
LQPPAYCRLQVRLMLPKMRACVRTWGHGIDTIGIRTRKIPAMNDHASDFRNHFPKWGRTRTGAAAAGGAGIQSSGISGSGASDHTTGNFNELLTRAASKLSVEARRAQCTLAARKSKGRKQEVYPGPSDRGPSTTSESSRMPSVGTGAGISTRRFYFEVRTPIISAAERLRVRVTGSLRLPVLGRRPLLSCRC